MNDLCIDACSQMRSNEDTSICGKISLTILLKTLGFGNYNLRKNKSHISVWTRFLFFKWLVIAILVVIIYVIVRAHLNQKEKLFDIICWMFIYHFLIYICIIKYNPTLDFLRKPNVRNNSRQVWRYKPLPILEIKLYIIWSRYKTSLPIWEMKLYCYPIDFTYFLFIYSFLCFFDIIHFVVFFGDWAINSYLLFCSYSFHLILVSSL